MVFYVSCVLILRIVVMLRNDVLCVRFLMNLCFKFKRLTAHL